MNPGNMGQFVCLICLLTVFGETLARQFIMTKDIMLDKKTATKFLERRKRDLWTTIEEECSSNEGGCRWEEVEENFSTTASGREFMKDYKCRSYRCSDGCTNTNTNYDHINHLSVACIVDGGWSDWTLYNKCSVTCGEGEMTRSRVCNKPEPQHGGQDCIGDSVETEKCNLQSCSVDGGWSDWNAYSKCSVTCGEGKMTRSRVCNNPEPQHGGQDCVGDAVQTERCNITPCSIDGGWSDWTVYSKCSVTCGEGEMTRSRVCNKPEPQHGGQECMGDAVETEMCNLQSCPVDGGWSDWSEFSQCSVTCGGGKMARSRVCDNPLPQHGGNNCTGAEKEIESCNTYSCPVDGGWSDWSGYNQCAVSCGDGTMARTRVCDNPEPNHGGNNCTGDGIETKGCNAGLCPVDGGWSDWSEFSQCPVTCGGGSVRRTRVCNKPEPQHGGKDCPGQSNENATCNTEICSVIKCSAQSLNEFTLVSTAEDVQPGTVVWYSCKLGYKLPNVEDGTRTCTLDGTWSNVAPECQEVNECESSPCLNNGTCDDQIASFQCDCQGDFYGVQCESLDGNWSDWEEISECSVTCGNGTRVAKRTCTKPEKAGSGKNCEGSDSQTKICTLKEECPLVDDICASKGNGDFVPNDNDCSSYYECSNGQAVKYSCQDGQHWAASESTCTDPDAANCSLKIVDGGWTDWIWDVCSVTCGGGMQTGRRSCSNPTPTNNGAQCIGETTHLRECRSQICQVRIDCGEPEVDDTTTEVKSNGTSPGSVAEYTCLQQMEFVSGDSVRICQMTGRWDGLRPVCQAEDGGYSAASSLSKAWATTATVALLVILFIDMLH